jgi:multiple sugar transport system permease protein
MSEGSAAPRGRLICPKRGRIPMYRLRFFHYLMIAPVQLLLIGIIFVPALYLVWLSLTRYTYGLPPEFVGFDNYVFIFSDAVFWRAVVNTLVVVSAVVLGELVLGVGLAVLMAGWVPGKRIVISLLLMPYAVTEVTAVVMWRYMLEPDVGMINWLLASVGLEQLNWAINRWDALLVVALLSIWLHLPFTFLILYAAVTTVPRELTEAAVVDGANRWQNFWHVTVPTIVPAILVAMMFRYIFALRLFSEVWLLTEGGPARLTEVLAVYLYRNGFRYQEFGVAAAAGWILTMLSLITASYYLYQLYKRMFKDA